MYSKPEDEKFDFLQTVEQTSKQIRETHHLLLFLIGTETSAMQPEAQNTNVQAQYQMP